jgi:histidyl-tRNA synthetase
MARVVASNPQLPKPFKRYAIAPAWRYEEVTAGRKREFYQCDIDVVGSSSMEADVECIAAAVDCLIALGFKNFDIVVNNRKILDGFIELIDIRRVDIDKLLMDEGRRDLDIFRAIDKIGKFGEELVKEELKKAGLNDEQIKKLMELISAKGDFKKVLEQGRKLLKGISIGEDGLKKMEELFEFGKIYGIDKMLILDFSLARGLDYYTGPIFEIKTKIGEKIGSIAAGGRYDNLIELLGGRPTPATGISLGIERIVEIMKENKMFNLPKTNVKIFVADVKVKNDAVRIAQELRKNGISCQTDLMNRNLTKQLEFANSLGVSYVLIVGEKEIKSRKFKLRDMQKKIEKEMNLEEVIKLLNRTYR